MSGELTGTGAPALPVSGSAFAEVEVSELAIPVFSPPGGSGKIGIELPFGLRLTVDAAVDADALARVIGVLTQ